MIGSNAFTKSAWTLGNLSSKGLKSAMKRSKKQQSKAYLKRKAQLYEKWSKKTPSLDELIEDLEWSVGIKP